LGTGTRDKKKFCLLKAKIETPAGTLKGGEKEKAACRQKVIERGQQS